MSRLIASTSNQVQPQNASDEHTSHIFEFFRLLHEYLCDAYSTVDTADLLPRERSVVHALFMAVRTGQEDLLNKGKLSEEEAEIEVAALLHGFTRSARSHLFKQGVIGRVARVLFTARPLYEHITGKKVKTDMKARSVQNLIRKFEH